MKDEEYILSLSDRVLGTRSKRQHRFAFLRGDPTGKGNGRRLPVDAFYAKLNLVIEYRERQHSERVALFDDRMTISGVSRAEQRRKYDARRRRVLPRHGLTLVEFDYHEFDHGGTKRLRRTRAADLKVISRKLARLVR